MRQVETATRLKQEQVELYELEEKGERLDSLSRGRKELKMRTLVEKSLGERQAMLREAIRDTKSEGLLLENQLKALRHERRTPDTAKKPESPVFLEAKVLLVGLHLLPQPLLQLASMLLIPVRPQPGVQDPWQSWRG